jgi:hypothetical protein
LPNSKYSGPNRKTSDVRWLFAFRFRGGTDKEEAIMKLGRNENGVESCVYADGSVDGEGLFTLWMK